MTDFGSHVRSFGYIIGLASLFACWFITDINQSFLNITRNFFLGKLFNLLSCHFNFSNSNRFIARRVTSLCLRLKIYVAPLWLFRFIEAWYASVIVGFLADVGASIIKFRLPVRPFCRDISFTMLCKIKMFPYKMCIPKCFVRMESDMLVRREFPLLLDLLFWVSIISAYIQFVEDPTAFGKIAKLRHSWRLYFFLTFLVVIFPIQGYFYTLLRSSGVSLMLIIALVARTSSNYFIFSRFVVVRTYFTHVQTRYFTWTTLSTLDEVYANQADYVDEKTINRLRYKRNQKNRDTEAMAKIKWEMKQKAKKARELTKAGLIAHRVVTDQSDEVDETSKLVASEMSQPAELESLTLAQRARLTVTAAYAEARERFIRTAILAPDPPDCEAHLEFLDAILAEIPASETDWIGLATDICIFLGQLWYAENVGAVCMACLSTLNKWIGKDISYKKILNIVEDLITPLKKAETGDMSEIVDQSDFLNGVSSNFKRMRLTLLGLETFPVYTYASKVLMVMSLCNAVPTCVLDKSKWISDCYGRYSLDLLSSLDSPTQVFQMVLDVIASTIDFVSATVGGKFDEMFRPCDIVSRVENALAKEHCYRIGTLVTSCNVTEAMYLAEITDVISRCKQIRESKAKIDILHYINKTLPRLKIIEMDLLADEVYCHPREPAPCVLFFGASHIGKSAIALEAAHLAGKVLNFETDASKRYYVNLTDNFDSGMTTSKTVIMYDDVAAPLPELFAKRTSGEFIRLVNIVPMMTTQAEAEKKGRIPFCHKIVIGTTNVENVDIPAVMNHAEAGFNRILFIHVTIIPEVLTTYADGLGGLRWETIPDSVKLTMHRYQAYRFVATTEASRMSAGYKRQDFGPKMNAREFHAYFTDYLLNKHVKAVDYLSLMADIDTMAYCEVCKCLGKYCVCPAVEPVEDQAIVNLPRIERFVMQNAGLWLTVENYAVFVEDYLAMRMRALPDVLLPCFLIIYRWSTHYVLVFLGIFKGRVIIYIWIGPFLFFSALLFLAPTTYFLRCWWYASLWLIYVALALYGSFRRRIMTLLMSELSQQPHFYALSYTCLALGVGWFSMKAFIKAFGRLVHVSDQGNLAPTCLADVDARCAEVNIWTDKREFAHPMNEPRSVTMTYDQAAGNLLKNILWVEIWHANNEQYRRRSNAVMLRTGRLLVNYHTIEPFVDKSNALMVSTRRGVDDFGSFVKAVAVVEWVRIPNDDFVIMALASAPSFRDIVPRFPSELMKPQSRALCALVGREKDGSPMATRKFEWTTCETRNERCLNRLGSEHSLNPTTLSGHCCSVVMMLSNPYTLLGLHVALKATGESVAFAMSRAILEENLANLEAKMEEAGRCEYTNHCLVLPVKRYEKELQVAFDAHERDFINFVPVDLPEEPPFRWVGSDMHQRATTSSVVQFTALRPHLEALGRPCMFGPPKIRPNYNYSEAWQKMLRPMKNIPTAILDRCIDDYCKDIEKHFSMIPLCARPLTNHQAVNGIPGDRHISGLVMKTSTGFGLKSPKSDHFITEVFSDHVVHTPMPYVQAEIDRIEAELERGEVPTRIFMGALKDEPTKITKTKVRVFEVGEMATTIVDRKYFLPVMASLYKIPLTSETAVGINNTTEEWDQLAKWLKQHGTHSCIEGDFSAFDMSQSGQMIRAVITVLRRLAIKLGYTKIEARKLALLGAGYARKFFNLNGTVVELDSVLPSGIPTTVCCNGIMNSLLHRYCVFKICEEYEIPINSFRELVNLMTMGDDSVGNVKCPHISMTNIQKWMASINMQYTDSHKNAVAIPFTQHDKLSFCKRGFRWSEELQHYVAPIHEDSIWKSVFCFKKSSTPALEVLVMNVSGAMRELARHERSVFEELGGDIRAACVSYGIDNMVTHLGLSYDGWQEILRMGLHAGGKQPEEEFTNSGSVEVTESQTTVTLNTSPHARLRSVSSDESERFMWDLCPQPWEAE